MKSFDHLGKGLFAKLIHTKNFGAPKDYGNEHKYYLPNKKRFQAVTQGTTGKS